MKDKETQRNPYPTADVIVELDDGIVLIKRKNPPLGWAIPGGFIDAGESVEEAAVREIAEETGLVVSLTDILSVYSSPDRDPRFHTMSVVFIGIGSGNISAGDDAVEASIFTRSNLPEPLAFDHKKILDDYFRYKETGEKPGPSHNRSR